MMAGNFCIESYEEYPCNDKEILNKREGYHLLRLQVSGGGGVGAGGGTLQAGEAQQDKTRNIPLLCV